MKKNLNKITSTILASSLALSIGSGCSSSKINNVKTTEQLENEPIVETYRNDTNPLEQYNESIEASHITPDSSTQIETFIADEPLIDEAEIINNTKDTQENNITTKAYSTDEIKESLIACNYFESLPYNPYTQNEFNKNDLIIVDSSYLDGNLNGRKYITTSTSYIINNGEYIDLYIIYMSVNFDFTAIHKITTKNGEFINSQIFSRYDYYLEATTNEQNTANSNIVLKPFNSVFYLDKDILTQDDITYCLNALNGTTLTIH